MNWILLEPKDLVSSDRAVLRGRRHQHVASVHRASVGALLRVALLGDRLGVGRVLRIDAHELELELTLDRDPPPRLGVTLLLALPRPRVLERVLITAAAFGVDQIWLLNSWRVEKSYWASPRLEPEHLENALRLGLELAGDTHLPPIELRRLFKPFVEDELASLKGAASGLVAHPAASREFPRERSGPTWLAIGPEGGFTSYEVEKLAKVGFEPVSLGARILPFEAAVPALLARIT
jgi:RsmE family RNA methyltransferase